MDKTKLSKSKSTKQKPITPKAGVTRNSKRRYDCGGKLKKQVIVENQCVSINKSLYKIELCLIKFTPTIIACIYLLNTILSYFYIDIPFLSYLGGISLLTIVFLYTSSYVFKFCLYHRLPIHYITLNWILNIFDYYIGIPINDKSMFMVYIIISGLTIVTILYLKYIKR